MPYAFRAVVAVKPEVLAIDPLRLFWSDTKDAFDNADDSIAVARLDEATGEETVALNAVPTGMAVLGLDLFWTELTPVLGLPPKYFVRRVRATMLSQNGADVHEQDALATAIVAHLCSSVVVRHTAPASVTSTRR